MRAPATVLATLLFGAGGAVPGDAVGASAQSGAADAGTRSLTVYAAASLTDVLTELARDYTRATGVRVRLSFGGTAVLVRQLEAGAPADLLFSADRDWMDYAVDRGLVAPATRADVAANRLVLVAPADSRVRLALEPGFDLAGALGRGRLAVADPDAVPAGRYARAALEALGAWRTVEHRLVRADNVRSALAFVARGEVPLGIVYATDARLTPAVRVVGTFPADSHPPIAYPGAVARGAGPGARDFLAWLQGPEAAAVFARHGFEPVDATG